VERCGFGCWLAQECETGRTIGYVGISVPTFFPAILPAVEVGWRFDPTVWGRGYAVEGARAALDQSFTTLGLDEVCSLPHAHNPRSLRVAEGLGMRMVREVLIPANARRGEVLATFFVITKAEWLAGRPVSPTRGRRGHTQA